MQSDAAVVRGTGAGTVEILGFGDTGPYFPPVEDHLKYVASTLAAADLRIGQCERLYTDLGARQNNGHPTVRLPRELADVFFDSGMDVVSLAGNLAMDFGPEAMLDTKEFFLSRGIQVVGVGRDSREARGPVFVERKGKRIAVLGYCSVLRKGNEAEPNKPGIAPLRVRTWYEPLWDWEPGSPAIVHTVPYEEDLAALREDITAAKADADFVVLMIHWGVHYVPRTIAEYQPVIADIAFNSGADVIFGHHAHVPKAIGVHSGKVCFYSLSNFIISEPSHSAAANKNLEPYGVFMDPDYPHLRGQDGKRSLIARARVHPDGKSDISFVPILIDKQHRPEPLQPGDPRFDNALQFMDWASEGFDHKFDISGTEVKVTSALAVSD
ncbi:MAG: CapA family protein [Acidimicrobiales bacterium]